VSVNILRVRIIKSIEEGDVTFDQIRSQLVNEFEKLNAKLDRILEEPLRTSKSKFEDAMIYLQHNKIDEANENFKESKSAAMRAFHLAPSYQGKLHASRIQLLCTAHLCGHFSGSCDKSELNHLCNRIFQELLSVAEVRSSLRDEFSSSGSMIRSVFQLPGSKKQRRQVLLDLAQYRHSITELTDQPPPSITSADGKAIKLSEMEPFRLSGHTDWVNCMIVSGGRLYSGSEDNTIRVWDMSTLECVRTLSGHTHYVECMIVSGDRLYSGSWDSTIRVWDMNTLECVRTLSGHTYSVNCMIISGGRLYSGSADRTIRVWDMNTLECVRTLSGHSSSVKCMILSGGRLYSGSEDNTIRVWDMSTLECVRTLSGHTESVNCMIVSGGRLYSGSYDKTIRVWDMNTFECVRTLSGHTDSVSCMIVSGGRLYSGSYDNSIQVWDMNTLECVRILLGYTHYVKCMIVSGGRIYSGSWDTIHVRLL